jgi:hypothetical protein
MRRTDIDGKHRGHKFTLRDEASERIIILSNDDATREKLYPVPRKSIEIEKLTAFGCSAGDVADFNTKLLPRINLYGSAERLR